ncbi:uncharacterized protein GIQ15_03801 [Arthroderma uncinatum]|uniref:uncharacterized protein n=1 Tax=Arthroderma uncinatum TaxID=74035 RepID=UPI00144A5CB3|nr:uncharacterized protein GIQ15_03801 [Arthroderma uncinatum]KAF3481042.1 hypothetical protein GIQ15_03801 [Arthroderma uncinatum]
MSSNITTQKAAGKYALSDITTLITAGTPALLRKDIARVRWAGIFGSFAVGEQSETSDVDVVVVHDPDDTRSKHPPVIWCLEDVLSEAWRREVDIVHITLGEDLRGYIAIESLLCSRTLYGSDTDPVIAQLLQRARDILNQGVTHFNNILSDIEKIKAMVSGKSEREFCSDVQLRQAVLEEVISIMDAINIQPRWHPLHGHFWYTLIEPSDLIRKKISDTKDVDASGNQECQLWELLWGIVTASGDGTFWDMQRRIVRFVLPIFEYTRTKSELVKKLERDGKRSAAGSPGEA